MEENKSQSDENNKMSLLNEVQASQEPSAITPSTPEKQSLNSDKICQKEKKDLKSATTSSSSQLKSTSEKKSVFKRSILTLSKAIKLYQTKNFENQELLKNLKIIKNRSNSVFSQYLIAQEQLHTLKKTCSEITEKYNKLHEDSMKYIDGEVIADLNKATAKVQYLESTIAQLEAEVTDYRTKNCRSNELEQEVLKNKQYVATMQTKVKSLEDQLSRKVEQMKALDSENRSSKKSNTLLSKAQAKNQELIEKLATIQEEHSQIYSLIEELFSTDDINLDPDPNDDVQKSLSYLIQFKENRLAAQVKPDQTDILLEKIDSFTKEKEGEINQLEKRHFAELQALEDSFKRKLDIETNLLKNSLISAKDELSEKSKSDQRLIESLRNDVLKLKEKSKKQTEVINSLSSQKSSLDEIKLQSIDPDSTSPLIKQDENAVKIAALEAANQKLLQENTSLRSANEQISSLEKQNLCLLKEIDSHKKTESSLFFSNQEVPHACFKNIDSSDFFNLSDESDTFTEFPVPLSNIADNSSTEKLFSPKTVTLENFAPGCDSVTCSNCELVSQELHDLKSQCNSSDLKVENELLKQQLQQSKSEFDTFKNLKSEMLGLEKEMESYQRLKEHSFKITSDNNAFSKQIQNINSEKLKLLEENKSLSSKVTNLEITIKRLNVDIQKQKENLKIFLARKNEDSINLNKLQKENEHLNRFQGQGNSELTEHISKNTLDFKACYSSLKEILDDTLRLIKTGKLNLQETDELFEVITHFYSMNQLRKDNPQLINELKTTVHNSISHLNHSNKNAANEGNHIHSFIDLKKDNKQLLAKYKKIKDIQARAVKENHDNLDRLKNENADLAKENKLLFKAKRTLQDTLTEQLIEIKSLKNIIKEASIESSNPHNVLDNDLRSCSPVPNTSEFEYSSPSCVTNSPYLSPIDNSINDNVSISHASPIISFDNPLPKRIKASEPTTTKKSTSLESSDKSISNTRDYVQSINARSLTQTCSDLSLTSFNPVIEEASTEIDFSYNEPIPLHSDSRLKSAQTVPISNITRRRSSKKDMFHRHPNWSLFKNIRRVIYTIPDGGDISSHRMDAYKDFSLDNSKNLVDGILEFLITTKDFMPPEAMSQPNCEYSIDKIYRVVFPENFCIWEQKVIIFILLFITRFPKSSFLELMLDGLSNFLASVEKNGDFLRHLCHIFGFLCKMTKDFERARVFAYDLLVLAIESEHILECFVALANTYPGPFSFSINSTQSNYFLNTCQSIIANMIPIENELKGTKATKDLYNILIRKCFWTSSNNVICLENIYNILVSAYSKISDESNDKISLLRLIYLLSLHGNFGSPDVI